MVSSADILAAFREVTNVKQIERSELYGLLQDGIFLKRIVMISLVVDGQ